jgi:hypothetical protein
MPGRYEYLLESELGDEAPRARGEDGHTRLLDETLTPTNYSSEVQSNGFPSGS